MQREIQRAESAVSPEPPAPVLSPLQEASRERRAREQRRERQRKQQYQEAKLEEIERKERERQAEKERQRRQREQSIQRRELEEDARAGPRLSNSRTQRVLHQSWQERLSQSEREEANYFKKKEARMSASKAEEAYAARMKRDLSACVIQGVIHGRGARDAMSSVREGEKEVIRAACHGRAARDMISARREATEESSSVVLQGGIRGYQDRNSEPCSQLREYRTAKLELEEEAALSADAIHWQSPTRQTELTYGPFASLSAVKALQEESHQMEHLMLSVKGKGEAFSKSEAKLVVRSRVDSLDHAIGHAVASYRRGEEVGPHVASIQGGLTLNPQPSTLNPQPSTLNPKP